MGVGKETQKYNKFFQAHLQNSFNTKYTVKTKSVTNTETNFLK